MSDERCDGTPQMKLWHCKAEVEFVVAAKEKPTNSRLVMCGRDEVDNNGFSVAYVKKQITTVAMLPCDWEPCSVPLGSEAHLTCEQILGTTRALYNGLDVAE